jgi:hypothetical protein
MADLTFLEKKKLEELLGMKSGYVLDFSDRTFSEFVRDSTGIDIFKEAYHYASGSKANRLRAFWQKEPNTVVAKLLNDLLDYHEGSGPVVDSCRSIVARLRGIPRSAKQPVENVQRAPTGTKPDSAESLHRSQNLRHLKDVFFRLAAETDRSKAGLALEKLLSELFELFQLQPRQPFRVCGEQIDGSFELDGQIYLLESKWEQDPLGEGPLLVFRGKIEGKSTFTRGVFVALNDISAQARDAITRGKAPSFFVMNGHDLLMILGEAINLADFLRRRVRLLAEEGRVCVPFCEVTENR